MKNDPSVAVSIDAFQALGVPFSFLVNACGGSCGPTPLVFTVANDDEGGDEADIDVAIVNEQR